MKGPKKLPRYEIQQPFVRRNTIHLRVGQQGKKFFKRVELSQGWVSQNFLWIMVTLYLRTTTWRGTIRLFLKLTIVLWKLTARGKLGSRHLCNILQTHQVLNSKILSRTLAPTLLTCRVLRTLSQVGFNLISDQVMEGSTVRLYLAQRYPLILSLLDPKSDIYLLHL